MAYMILQPCQEYLEPSEIVRRVDQVFSDIDIDADTGNQFLADRINALCTIRESLEAPAPCLAKQIELLRELQRRCLIVTIKSQSGAAKLKITLVPNEPALVVYDEETPQEAFWQCVFDFVNAIDYEIELPFEPELSADSVEEELVPQLAADWRRALAWISQGIRHRWGVARAGCLALVNSTG